MVQNLRSRRQQRRLEANRNTRRIIESLDRYSKLRRKMVNCEMPSIWRRKEYCRAVGCGVCRQRYIASETKAALSRFADTENANMALLTIVLGVTLDPDQIGPLFESGRRKLRNIVDYQRRRSRRWDDVEVLGYLETDALNGIQVDEILPERRSLLHDLGLPQNPDQHEPIWVVTIHAVVKFDKVGRQSFSDALTKSWPQNNQVDVRPIIISLSTSENISNIIEYALKHENITHISDFNELAWQSEWLSAFYESMMKWSKSFKRMKLNIRPKGFFKKKNDSECGENNESDEQNDSNKSSNYYEPMPILFRSTTFSTFPYQYILGEMPSRNDDYESSTFQMSSIMSQGP